ncbi:hypothetical protein [Streptomyces sp. NRRL F-5123]|uniref:hypothetical protein n=1 Tax=Streptomyces sp. NRRL F-5123 TaxID=1463856 RepID=UPI0004E28A08|nr:hypothetical protein [Streptomyces sp. NRRL F-5123]
MRISTKRRGINLAVVSAVAACGLIFSTTNASAATGEVGTAYCDAWIVGVNGVHWGAADLDGSSNCEVQLWQTNINTGGWTNTGWSVGPGWTTPLYHGDGVHELQIEVYDPNTNQTVWGPMVY